MASVSANFLCARTSVRVPPNQMMLSKSLRLATVGWGRTPGFPRLATSRFQITCAAKKETVDKVCEIVRKQLALPADKEITPQTTFTDLGADSLDTVEIVMGLEEEFDITVQEDNQDNITCIQEAADLIEQLVAKKS
ncbi:acyl carrier protein 1, chloroplastic-like isoform X3 [Salvia miltiorrhiza]|uniref:Acyl carrier protein n=1 Tax=Salvia miltiorrhiza TaxID=226208 RepID=A0A0G2SJN3_SALMI|nr:acyl carrier protein 1, chloroplastic-like isoform X3 [Salvia miltiorrhiza]XP_057767670.1 acyl carrier protein 1, chloroplastic-like isoform X3 [Salvia miltiorrhiza]XP_057767671.1 acyl carrier protein 1, chloroplastic-like isoform X3 [Salvia miltiorrhiza]XP_057767672.1 acyl carrier protein 1, chloroplastic-like isoform X3 [Salvia miltiorrhiza]XP_057767674.1 acyl carrier protein 1, chloroplastic-like isoform X3 [Salvia miltiorrhiza]AJQ20617.1 Acyl Carrier Protein [Salvia miltiorrhiza]